LARIHPTRVLFGPTFSSKIGMNLAISVVLN